MLLSAGLTKCITSQHIHWPRMKMMWTLISPIKRTKYSRACDYNVPWGPYLESQLLIRKTNPDLQSRQIRPQISAHSDRLTHLYYLAKDFTEQFSLSSWHAISPTTDEVLANMNGIIQSADFEAFPWLIGCELTCFLRPSRCLLLTVANNHRLTMPEKTPYAKGFIIHMDTYIWYIIIKADS